MVICKCVTTENKHKLIHHFRCCLIGPIVKLEIMCVKYNEISLLSAAVRAT